MNIGDLCGESSSYVYIVVVVTEQRPRHNLRSRSGGSILSIKGCGLGAVISIDESVCYGK